MFFHIKVSAKDKKVLENFGQFISKLQLTSNSLRLLSKRNLRKFVTVLKSPHVNKTAQEQFEFRVYTKEFIISSFKPLTLFLILKKVNDSSFSGLNLKIESLFKQNTKKIHRKLKIPSTESKHNHRPNAVFLRPKWFGRWFPERG